MNYRTKFFTALFILFFLLTNAHSQIKKVNFNPKNLTKQEIADCKKFRELEGKNRWDQFKKIEHLISQPPLQIVDDKTISYNEDSIEVIITKDQIIALIGLPFDATRCDGKCLDYDLDAIHKKCKLNIVLNDKNEITFHGFGNCEDHITE